MFARPPWEKGSPPLEVAPNYKIQDKDRVGITALGICPSISTTLWSLFFFPLMHDPKDALASKTCISGLAGQVQWVPIHLMTKLRLSLSFGKVHLTLPGLFNPCWSLSGGQASKTRLPGAVSISPQNWNLTKFQGLSHQVPMATSFGQDLC